MYDSLNPVIAEKLLKELMESPNGIVKVCAKKFGVDHKTFTSILDTMGMHKLISSVPPSEAGTCPFVNIEIENDETEVEVMILDEGKQYLDKGRTKKSRTKK